MHEGKWPKRLSHHQLPPKRLPAERCAPNGIDLPRQKFISLQVVLGALGAVGAVRAFGAVGAVPVALLVFFRGRVYFFLETYLPSFLACV